MDGSKTESVIYNGCFQKGYTIIEWKNENICSLLIKRKEQSKEKLRLR